MRWLLERIGGADTIASAVTGYRHLPLHDAQLSQYLFSTLFVKIDIEDAA